MKRIFTVLLLIIALNAYSQQDPLFTQYMFNKLALNPGYAGSRDVLSGDILYRNQWVNLPGAPKTISASIHSPLRNPHLALGLTAYNDKLGPASYTGALGTFAYRLIFPNAKLSFGLQAGFKYNDIDWAQLNPADAGDPLIINQLKKKVVPDANFGIYYYSSRFYVGLSSKQLLQNQSLVIKNTDGKTAYTKLLAHFYGMAGVAVPINENIIFRPSILGKFVKGAPPQLDANASVLLYNTLWLGASYRTEKALAFITEFNITHNLRLGYSYDVWLNELKAYNKGSHEIRLGFDLDIFNNRMLTPRYF